MENIIKNPQRENDFRHFYQNKVAHTRKFASYQRQLHLELMAGKETVNCTVCHIPKHPDESNSCFVDLHVFQTAGLFKIERRIFRI